MSSREEVGAAALIHSTLATGRGRPRSNFNVSPKQLVEALCRSENNTIRGEAIRSYASTNEMSSETPASAATASTAEVLLLKAHPKELADQIFIDKIKSRTLNLNPTQPTEVEDGRAQRRRERLKKLALQRKSQKPKPLTAKEKRKLKIYEIPKDCQKYDIYVPLHELWLGYVQDVLFGDGGMAPRPPVGMGSAERGKSMMAGQELGAKVMSADLHGAEVKIVRSRCPTRVGLKGIIVKETKMTFEVVTKEDVIKSKQPSITHRTLVHNHLAIPKEHTVFQIEIPPKVPKLPEGAQTIGQNRNLVFQVHGTNFMYRAAERGSKKFKAKPTWDI
ncbi:Rof/RNase P-like protein [Peziza echinospora]|nr:Rof/RNase P-like protein [Peziza echinospora]